MDEFVLWLFKLFEGPLYHCRFLGMRLIVQDGPESDWLDDSLESLH